MTSAFNVLFHAQSYEDAWENYQRFLNNPDYACWDYLILTASNEKQAEGFRAQLAERSMPHKMHIAVISDPDGKRVGSGGATLNVINYIRQRELRLGHEGFDHLRILVIHSGGDSKRTPQYSALGKLFSPVPHELPDGRSSTLFDEFMISMAGVPSRIKEGMLLLSGDVLLLFNPLQINYHGYDAAAISFKEPAEVGKEFGVYLRGEKGNVAKCLQKQSVDVLRTEGAINDRNEIDIDTGAVIFSKEMLESLYQMTKQAPEKYINEKARLSLYADFLYVLGEEATLEKFYLEKPEGEFSSELRECRTDVWKALRPYRLKLLRLAPAKFIHFGTTTDIMQLMSQDIGKYKLLKWSSVVNSSLPEGISGYNSVCSPKATVGKNVHLETAYVHSKGHVGNNVLLSYIDIHDEHIPDNVVIHGLKQRDGRFVVRIWGIQDNPKQTKLFGRELREIGIEGSLWTAEIYPVCDTIAQGVQAALKLFDYVVHDVRDESWEGAEKKSLCSGFIDADSNAIIAWDKRMHELIEMGRLERAILDGVPCSEFLKRTQIKRDGLTNVQNEWLEQKLKTADSAEQVRLEYYLGKILVGSDGEKYLSKSFRTIHDEMLSGAVLYENKERHIVCNSYTVKLPLRVNWGGGWSDTPPYCLENGGTVLNAAIMLNGQLPVEVTLEKLSEKKVILDSHDLNVHGEFTDIRDLQSVGDPYDPFVLQKAVLHVCGVIPIGGGDLGSLLEHLGGGFIMKSEVRNVPKGSGLGTSSILAAACVKALYGFMGIESTEKDIYACVLLIEQMMSTGGGWQDQVGGLTNGIKFITTMPGINQEIDVQPVHVPDRAMTELQSRFALIYTGQRRLARHLLRDVVGRYIGNEPDTIYALNEIQRKAALMRFELERGHIDDFAKLLNEHWELSKMIDSGSSNTLIEQIFATIDDMIDGKFVCGAGGGGFLQIIMKKGITHEELRARLKEVFGDSAVDVYHAEFV